MKPLLHFAACIAVALSAAGARAQETDWLSYRDAYRAMVVFEKYGQPKQLLQQHYQVSARDGSPLPASFKLGLSGKGTQLNLPLDPLGRAVFPLLKAAYDENAVLTVNRKLSGYLLRPRVSIVTRPDGVYEAAELRAACEQALAYQRYAEPSGYRARRCVGVRYAFAQKTDAVVRTRKAGGDGAPLPVVEGPAFQDEPAGAYSTVAFRFEPGDKGQVVTQNPPLAIAPWFE